MVLVCHSPVLVSPVHETFFLPALCAFADQVGALNLLISRDFCKCCLLLPSFLSLILTGRCEGLKKLVLGVVFDFGLADSAFNLEFRTGLCHVILEMINYIVGHIWKLLCLSSLISQCYWYVFLFVFKH